MLKITQFDPQNLKKYEAYGGRYTTWEDLKFDDPSCIAAFTEKRREDDLSAPWLFWNDEVWYVIQGEMEIEWSNPPMFNDHHTATLKPGDVVWVRTGLRVKSRVLSEEPFRFVWIAMPRPRYFGSDQFWDITTGGADRNPDGLH